MYIEKGTEISVTSTDFLDFFFFAIVGQYLAAIRRTSNIHDVYFQLRLIRRNAQNIKSWVKMNELTESATEIRFLEQRKREGRAFRNIGKYIPILFNHPCLFSSTIQFNLYLLIRSCTPRGSGTSILSRWSLQKLTSAEYNATYVHTIA